MKITSLFTTALATSAVFVASNAHAQSSKIVFDLNNFNGQNVAFQTWNGSQMQTVKGGAGLLKTQLAQSGQTVFDITRDDWFYTLCVEPTAWLVNNAATTPGTTKDLTQPWKTPSDAKTGDTLALLYHNFASRNPAYADSPLVANTSTEQAGLQVAFWEILNDFDSTKGNFGLDLSQGLFNFKLSYADGSVNRQDVLDSANLYLSYAKDTINSGKDISGYQAQFFHVNNTTDSKGNRLGQDVVGGRSVPEPGTLALALLGLVPLVARRRK